MASTIDMEKQPLLDSNEAVTPTGEEASLSQLQQNVFKAQREYMKAWSRTTSGKWHKRLIFGITGLLMTFMLFCLALVVMDGLDDDYQTFDGRVPLEAHIMSKCPDARDCLHDMILPAMQNISHKVDFKLSYIGNATEHDDGVSCKHGEGECLGNIVELCAAQLYPDPKTYLGFVMCMTREYEDIPERSLIEDCALEHSISMQRLNNCAMSEDGAVGLDMLRSSFNRSATAGVTKSCTIRLNGKTRCVRDGGEWTDCAGGSEAVDLVRDVREQSRLNWEKINA
ncbi:hypothetical protein LTR78_002035 [Recurvomyces mirabilis]|uniref:Gamma interferon inducible lysosomal thiol reductase n=1 Tax=Recurvomyces mirabilis TaxID=574656 RepID=A0AAE0WUB5_9PEZI|nr:hypothetical protein LTR78_002035 [Recurvomyces mirabilis]KAK5160493.1 hypothetical protein LTS14_001505 [Recurvomyces mirabilis]